MDYQYASYTDTGCRSKNEDSICISSQNNSLLCLVADGVGGHKNGEVASKMAVDIISAELNSKEIDEDELLGAILMASAAIRDADISGHTTIASLWFKGNSAVAAHVGDSRIYQFRDQKIIFQSLDHSMVQMAVLVGELPPDAVRHHKDRNKIFRVLGEQRNPTIDSTELPVKSGDCFLLCSDGFWEPVTETDMLNTLAKAKDAEAWLAAMRNLIAAARDPKQDNHTAVCVFIK